MDRATRVHTSVIAKKMEFYNNCHATMGEPQFYATHQDWNNTHKPDGPIGREQTIEEVYTRVRVQGMKV